MAKSIYVGVSSVARKMTKEYAGVSAVARKVSKIYVGVSGVARLSFSGETINATNLLPGPSFETWYDGWSYTDAKIVTGAADAFNGTGYLKSDYYENESMAWTSSAHAVVGGHVYYAAIHARCSGANRRVTLAHYGPGTWTLVSKNPVTDTENVWRRYSNITTCPGTRTANYLIYLGFQLIHVDGAMVIDLTAAYGAGLEPNQAWCDSNIPFFIGTAAIPKP